MLTIGVVDGRAQDRKAGSAVRVESGCISVDGVLDEEVWRLTTPITDFIQKEPTEGVAPTDDTLAAVLATAVQPAERSHLGTQRPAPPPDAGRRGHVGPDPAHRARVNGWDQFRSITAPGWNYFIVKSLFWIPF